MFFFFFSGGGGATLVGLDGGLIDVLFSHGEDYKYCSFFPHGMKVVAQFAISLEAVQKPYLYMFV